MTVFNPNFFNKNDIKNDLSHLYVAIESGLQENIMGIPAVNASDLEDVFESMTWSIARCSDLTTARKMVNLGINLMVLYGSLNTVIEEIKGGHDFITALKVHLKVDYLENVLTILSQFKPILNEINMYEMPKNLDYRGKEFSE